MWGGGSVRTYYAMRPEGSRIAYCVPLTVEPLRTVGLSGGQVFLPGGRGTCSTFTWSKQTSYDEVLRTSYGEVLRTLTGEVLRTLTVRSCVRMGFFSLGGERRAR